MDGLFSMTVGYKIPSSGRRGTSRHRGERRTRSLPIDDAQTHGTVTPTNIRFRAFGHTQLTKSHHATHKMTTQMVLARPIGIVATVATGSGGTPSPLAHWFRCGVPWAW